MKNAYEEFAEKRKMIKKLEMEILKSLNEEIENSYSLEEITGFEISINLVENEVDKFINNL